MSPLRSLNGGGSQTKDMFVESNDVTLTCEGAAVGAVGQNMDIKLQYIICIQGYKETHEDKWQSIILYQQVKFAQSQQ